MPVFVDELVRNKNRICKFKKAHQAYKKNQKTVTVQQKMDIKRVIEFFYSKKGASLLLVACCVRSVIVPDVDEEDAQQDGAASPQFGASPAYEPSNPSYGPCEPYYEEGSGERGWQGEAEEEKGDEEIIDLTGEEPQAEDVRNDCKDPAGNQAEGMNEEEVEDAGKVAEEAEAEAADGVVEGGEHEVRNDGEPQEGANAEFRDAEESEGNAPPAQGAEAKDAEDVKEEENKVDVMDVSFDVNVRKKTKAVYLFCCWKALMQVPRKPERKKRKKPGQEVCFL